MSTNDTSAANEGPTAASQEGAAPRRRPELGGYARGEETRNRIIVAALNAFGTDGYTRASTRKIAAEAGVNPPALQYYFDSKEGLHLACAQYIIDRVSAALGPGLARVAGVVESSDRTQAMDLICDILDVMVDTALDPEAINWKPFMARAQADGAGPAYPLIRDQIASPLHAALARLVAAATGGEAEDEFVRVRSAMIMSQMNAFNINRQSTLKLMCWPDFGGERLALIKAAMRMHTRGALSAHLG